MICFLAFMPSLTLLAFPHAEALCTAFAAELVVAAVSRCCNIAIRSGNRPRRCLDQARELKRRVGSSVKLIMNDRADLCLAAGFDGVMLGKMIFRLKARSA